MVTDNLYNSSTEVLNRIELICGKKPEFFQLDITDEAAIDKIFEAHPDIDSVIHFAALKVDLLQMSLRSLFPASNSSNSPRPSASPARSPSTITGSTSTGPSVSSAP